MRVRRPYISSLAETLRKRLGRPRYAGRLKGAFERFAKIGTWWDARFLRIADWLCATRLRSTYGERLEYIGHVHSEIDRRERWTRADDTSNRLTIVVVSYQQPEALACLLESLRCQTRQNFRICVYHDGPHPPTRALMERYIAEAHDIFRYVETEQRFNDWGHSLRDRGVREARSEFVLITNGDNYYSPRFVEYLFEAIDTHDLDVAICDMVHSHADAGARVVPPYSPLRTFPFRYHADIGCFIARLDMAQRRGFRDRGHDGDATYLEDILGADRPVRIGKVNRTLMVHN